VNNNVRVPRAEPRETKDVLAGQEDDILTTFNSIYRVFDFDAVIVD
jgi:hypothetical protein